MIEEFPRRLFKFNFAVIIQSIEVHVEFVVFVDGFLLGHVASTWCRDDGGQHGSFRPILNHVQTTSVGQCLVSFLCDERVDEGLRQVLHIFRTAFDFTV